MGFASCAASTSVAPNYFCLLFIHPGNHHSSNPGTLIDLAELDAPSSSSPVLAPAPDPPSGIPILPPPPQPSGPGRSRSSSQAEAPPGPNTASNAVCLLDEELLCLGASGREAAKGSSSRAGREDKMARDWEEILGAPRVLSESGEGDSVVGRVKFRALRPTGPSVHGLWDGNGRSNVVLYFPLPWRPPQLEGLPSGGCLYPLPTD